MINNLIIDYYSQVILLWVDELSVLHFSEKQGLNGSYFQLRGAGDGPVQPHAESLRSEFVTREPLLVPPGHTMTFNEP